MAMNVSRKIRITGFPPVISVDARTLILGSMPGEESLRSQQYYAHPRNAFWRIIATLGSNEPVASYDKRLEMLAAHRLALWDVLYSCHRPGSLDSAIEKSSVQANDFEGLFTQNPDIRRIFFNGAFAEKSYHKHVFPYLSRVHADIAMVRLPSTSPAHAGLRYEDKLDAWRVILD